VIRVTDTPTGQVRTWINAAADGANQRRDATLQSLDANTRARVELDLNGAFLSRVEAAELDAATSTAGHVELTITPTELVRSTPDTAVSLPTQRRFLVNNFRVSLAGLNGARVTKVGGLGFSVAKTPTSVSGRPRFAPGAVTTLPAILEFTTGGDTETNMRTWVDNVRRNGSDLRDGTIDFLNPSLTSTLWAWSLRGAQPRSAVEPFGFGDSVLRFTTTLRAAGGKVA
jgi:hypothetical protein